MTVFTACGEGQSYGAATDALRGWLSAVEDGDERACDLETDSYRDELVAENTAYSNPDLTCQDRVKQMAALRGEEAAPAPNSDIEVVELSPGEALMEVTEPGRNVKQYWMMFEGGRWLVAGDE